MQILEKETIKSPDFKYMCNLENDSLILSILSILLKCLHMPLITKLISNDLIWLLIQQRIPTDPLRDLLY